MCIERKAIILSKRKYKEYDEIVWFYIDKIGFRIEIINGANKLKNKYKGNLELFSIINLKIKILKNYKIKIIDFENTFLNTNKNLIEKYCYFNNISKLIIKTIPQNKIIDNLFDTLRFVIENFDKIKQKKSILMSFIMKTIISYTGILVNLSCCTICNSKKNLYGFSYYEMGLICKNCLIKNEKYYYSGKEIKILVAFNRLTLNTLLNIKIHEEELIIINKFWNDIFKNYVGINIENKESWKYL